MCNVPNTIFALSSSQLSDGGWVLSGETVPIGDRDPPRFKSVLYLEQFSILTSLEHLVR